MMDPTLQTNEIIAPGTGVHGKNVLSVAEGAPGPFSKSDSKYFDPATPSKNAENFIDPTLQVDPENSIFEKIKKSEKILSTTPDFENLEKNFQKEQIQKKNKKNLEIEVKDYFDQTPTEITIQDPKELSKKLMSVTKYDDKYAEMMIEFFLKRPKTKNITETYTWRNGSVDEKYKTIACPPPMLSEFGRTIGVSEKTLKSWAKKNKVFGEAYEICQDIIQEFFVENGLAGNYAGQFSIFAAKNLTKMKDVQVNKNENYDMKSVLDAIEKGVIVEADYEQQ